MPEYITDKILKNKFTNTEVQEYKNNVIQTVKKPIISVILFTYQHVEYIEESLRGILKQNLTCEWEIIIGDDESKDGTRELCMKYAKMYPDKIRFFLHSQNNSRRILNKPCGIFQMTFNLLKARGKYIAICSGDDIWTDPLKLQKQFETIIRNDNISLCFQPWRKVYKNKNKELVKDEINYSYPKASSTFYKNINHLLPIQILNVIQEDEFQYFILRRIGKFELVENLSPVLINSPTDSITNTLDIKSHESHVLNLNENILKAYFKSNYRNSALKLSLSFYKDLLIKSKIKTIVPVLGVIFKSILNVLK